MNCTKFPPLLATPDRHAPPHLREAPRDGRRQRWPNGRVLGSAVAAALLLVFLASSAHAPSDAQEVAWLNRLAAAGNADAQLQLGLAYRDGRYGLVPDAANGRHWLQKAAANGQRYAADVLAGQPVAGAALAPGHSRLDDLATQLNSPTLVTLSALWKILGFGLTDGQSSVSLQARAQAGDPVAEYQLAMRYRDGAWSVTRDPAKAFYWLQHAAGDGYPIAMQTLSEVYRSGALGVAPDLDKAARWQERAAATSSPHG